MARFIHITIPANEITARPAHTNNAVALILGADGVAYIDRDAAFALVDQLRESLRVLAEREDQEDDIRRTAEIQEAL